MNTRRRPDGEPKAQEAYASSVEHERGLLANLVAARCQQATDPRQREAIWLLQWVSWQPGGLEKFALDLIAFAGSEPVSRSFMGWAPGEDCDCLECHYCFIADEPKPHKGRYLLKTQEGVRLDLVLSSEETGWSESMLSGLLASHFAAICLDPAMDAPVRIDTIRNSEGQSITFPDLLGLVLRFGADLATKELATSADTVVRRQLFDLLDYTAQTGCMSLAVGETGTGKSIAAAAWSRGNPGRARLVRVPSSPDKLAFMHAVAEALGIASGTGMSAQKIQVRVQDTLRASKLMLILDGGQWLWPQGATRERKPERVHWLCAELADFGVPVAIVATGQFHESMRLAARRVQFNVRQFNQRIGRYDELAARLEMPDLLAIARLRMPYGETNSIQLLAEFANGSVQGAAAIARLLKAAEIEALRRGAKLPEFRDLLSVFNQFAKASEVGLRAATAGAPLHSPVSAGPQPQASQHVAPSPRSTTPPTPAPAHRETTMAIPGAGEALQC